MTLPDALAEIDAIFDRFADRKIAPGLVYGVVAGGDLIHSRGIGTLTTMGESRPDADSVFRIASMTKSFTAAAVLLLRDEGRLRLDDPVGEWVPELADLPPMTADSPPITLDHLLTMSAGFPTDDPWGDRQQGLDLAAFSSFLAAHPSIAWPSGTHFVYSNLGYGILGRVVTSASGTEYRDFVRERLLVPLGMTATTFDREDVPPDRLALGYVRRDDAWLEEPIDPYGALASMGGIFTSVRDLARWVGGLADAFPPRDDPDDDHPLRRASRREMQEVHRPFDPEVTWPSADAPPSVLVPGYGYGVFTSSDLRYGRIVGHGGGYPGFGSHMRWHPASGFGVIAFGNSRYAPLIEPLRDALRLLLDAEPSKIRRVNPWPATLAARTVVEGLLASWDEEAAASLFAMNIDLDEPIAIRRAAIEGIRDVHGALRPDETAKPESFSPAHLAWWMDGERGRVRVEILMSPERPPRLQALTLTSVPEPPAVLAAIAARLSDLLAQPGATLPEDILLAPSADRSGVERALRAAEARFGPVALGRPTGGDGLKVATWALSGPRGDLSLELESDGAGGPLTRVAFVPAPMEPPVLAD